jgi:hypothetical protein
MSRIVTVLYEDQCDVKPTNYGPHILLLACVADARGGDAWALRAWVKAIPKNGDSKLRTALHDEGELIALAGPLVAMFDEDRVRRCYGLPKDTCKRDVLGAIDGEATGSPRVVLLQRNMEDVVNAACTAMGHPVPARKPRPEERDRILLRAAMQGRGARDEVLQKVPSFARLVRIVGDWLAVLDGDEV